MSKSLESITIIASDFCESIGDSNEIQHIRYQKYLLKGYKKIFQYLSPELDVMTVAFPVDGQIELPCDFVYETKIGLLKDNCLVTLDLNKDLRLSNKKSTDTQMQTEISGLFDGSITATEFMPFYNYCRGDSFLGELYGMGCGFHSNQWYNINDGVLEIGTMIPDDLEVVVEYKSNGLKDGFKLVPTEMVPYLENNANMHFYAHTKPSLAGDFERKAKEEYYRLKRLYSYRKPEYLAWLWKSQDRPAHY